MSTGRRLLELTGVTIRFGGLCAVQGVDLVLEEGDLVGLIGPNGAGKTTVFNLVTGVYAPTEGCIRLEGRAIERCGPCEISRLGVARTFQNIRLFGSLSVLDNVRVAANRLRRTGPLQALVRGRRFREDEGNVVAKCRELLELFGLDEVRDEPAKALPYGDQRRLEIVRALATAPRLLLLDEPAAGMNGVEKEELMRVIREIRERFRLTVLLVEHSMRVVMGVCERIAVLDHGMKIAEGTPGEVRNDPRVVEAYLGDAGSAAHH